MNTESGEHSSGLTTETTHSVQPKSSQTKTITDVERTATVSIDRIGTQPLKTVLKKNKKNKTKMLSNAATSTQPGSSLP